MLEGFHANVLNQTFSFCLSHNQSDCLLNHLLCFSLLYTLFYKIIFIDIKISTVTKGRDRPTQTPNPCFRMLPDNEVFRPILLLNLLCRAQYTLEVYLVTKDSPKTNLISHSDSYIYWSITVWSPGYKSCRFRCICLNWPFGYLLGEYGFFF